MFIAANVIIGFVSSVVFSLFRGLFAPQQEGPKSDRNDAPRSEYGVNIAKVYGAARLSGSMIWAGIKGETRTGGGKDGPVTYSYFGNFAYLICEGEADIISIYFNNKLWWSIAPDSTSNTLQNNSLRTQYFTFYRGTLNQPADPTIQAEEGINNTPAFRGWSYIVFHGLPLADYGNGLPFPSFEVLGKVAVVSTFQSNNGLLEGTGYTVTLAAYDNQGVRQQFTTTTPNAVWGIRSMNTQPVTSLEPRGEIQIYGPDYTKTIAAGPRWGTVGTAKPSGLEILSISPSGSSTPSANALAVAQNGGFLISSLLSGNGIYYVHVTYGDGTLASIGVTGTPPFYLGSSSSQVVTSPISSSYFSSGILDRNYLIDRIFDATNTVIYTIPPGPQDRFLGMAGWIPGVLPLPISPQNYGQPFTGAQVAISNNFANATAEPNTTNYVAASLSSVVRDICQRVRISPSKIDTTEIDGMTTRGYRILSTMTARAALEALQQIYFFHILQIGGKLVCRRYFRPIEDARNTPEFLMEDNKVSYGAEMADPMILPISIQLEYSAFTKHLQNSAQYARRYPPATTIGGLLDTMGVTPFTQDNIRVVTFPVVLTDDEALTKANQILSIAMSKQRNYQFKWPPHYLQYELADVIPLKFPGSDYIDRVSIDSIDLGDDFSLEVKATSYDEAFNGIALTVDSISPSVPNTIGSGASTNLAILDIPIWNGSTDDSVVYVALWGSTTAWSGASVVVSQDDGVSFNGVGSSATPATIGKVNTAPLVVPTAYVDLVSELIITLETGSGTDLNTLTDAIFNKVDRNFIHVNGEILQFKTATLVGTRQYKLTTLRRGLFGTNQYVGSAGPGDLAVLLSNALMTVSVPTSELNQIVLIKAITFGQNSGAAPQISFIAKGNSIKPPPVSRIVAGVGYPSGDITISWSRRARKYVQWIDYSDAPYNNDIDQYIIEIYSIADQFIRSTTVTATNYLYPAATFNADLPAATSFKVKIYQFSPTVGKGWESEALVVI